MMLKNIRVVLIQTTHPGNIGAVARAMKNMGLSQLVLVNPKCYPHDEATARAASAGDILENATLTTELETAIADCHWVYGTSARSRHFPWPQLSARAAAEEIHAQANANQEIAILFGPEHSGLSNSDLQACDYHLTIPANPEYPSINLAQAVQILSYEIFQQQHHAIQLKSEPKASHQQVAQLLKLMHTLGVDTGFVNANQPSEFQNHIKRVFTKAQLTPDEANLLIGLNKKMMG